MYAYIISLTYGSILCKDNKNLWNNLKKQKNEAKRLNISDITVSNDDRLREWFKEQYE
ncbi:toxin-antitoxin system, antitoxin component, Xre domain protein [Prevotella bivia]|nr:toxin-antitoxin system, antitoxin component, Xre domain protein [Prevotella bivia]